MSSLILHSVLAGVVAVAATVAVERFGGRLGGVLTTLPTTIVPASIGLSATHHGEDLASALAIVPAGMALNAAFLWLWQVLPPRLPAVSLGLRLALMSLLTLSAWFIAALTLVLGTQAWNAAGQPSAVLGTVGVFLLLGGGLWLCRDLPPAPRGTRRVGPVTLVARGLFAGGAIGTAILLGEVAGPVAGGVASVFPAIFLTAMVSLWLSQGEAVPLGAIGPMVLGSCSVALYALFAAALMPAFGLWGAGLSWVLAVVGFSLPAGSLLTRFRRDASEAPTPAR